MNCCSLVLLKLKNDLINLNISSFVLFTLIQKTFCFVRFDTNLTGSSSHLVKVYKNNLHFHPQVSMRLSRYHQQMKTFHHDPKKVASRPVTVNSSMQTLQNATLTTQHAPKSSSVRNVLQPKMIKLLIASYSGNMIILQTRQQLKLKAAFWTP